MNLEFIALMMEAPFKDERLLYEPSALTVSNAAFCMVLNVNSDYFLKQR
jgi:hypothetical protein